MEEFEVGDIVVNIVWGGYGIILEHLPYEFDEEDLDSDMHDDYLVFWLSDEETFYMKSNFLKKVD